MVIVVVEVVAVIVALVVVVVVDVLVTFMGVIVVVDVVLVVMVIVVVLVTVAVVVLVVVVALPCDLRFLLDVKAASTHVMDKHVALAVDVLPGAACWLPDWQPHLGALAAEGAILKSHPHGSERSQAAIGKLEVQASLLLRRVADAVRQPYLGVYVVEGVILENPARDGNHCQTTIRQIRVQAAFAGIRLWDVLGVRDPQVSGVREVARGPARILRREAALKKYHCTPPAAGIIASAWSANA